MVARHVPADVVNFSVEPDITRLVREGLVDEDWKKRYPNNSTPFGSVVSLVVREGNPKGIHGWDDLVRPGVEVITPNPSSSGSAKWNLLAPFAGARRVRRGHPRVVGLPRHLPDADPAGAFPLHRRVQRVRRLHRGDPVDAVAVVILVLMNLLQRTRSRA
jgi:Bacterial extracellular solute-binding protein